MHGVPLTELAKRISAVDARYGVEAPISKVRPIYTLSDQLYVDPHPHPDGVLGNQGEISIEMSREEVAIALSHVKAWEQIAAGEAQYALVLEDDVYFHFAFAKVFDQAWLALTSKEPVRLDVLYASYEVARGGAQWTVAPTPVRRPVRGIWQLSGYVLSRRGAAKLLERLPVRGPVDLWINLIFGELDVFTLSRSVIKQRRDVPSGNFYSVLPILSKVGLITSTKVPSVEQRGARGPIFGFGETGTGVTALGTALSMLGYRCCSDVTRLPRQEHRALFDGACSRLFDAYVNVGSLAHLDLLHLAKRYPEFKLIVTSYGQLVHRYEDNDDHSQLDPNDGYEVVLRQSSLSSLDLDSAQCLVLPADHPDRWQLLTEFLDCDYPSFPYPRGADQPQRPVRLREHGAPAKIWPERTPIRWDTLPWIAASKGWNGVPLIEQMSTDDHRLLETFESSGENGWLLRDDTFPGNLALFSPSNFVSHGPGAGQLTLRRERTSVRHYTSAALSTKDSYRYGRFAADLRPAKASGLVTGMFLHRNSPRQEIDIEFLGNDTTKMLVNVFFNPGDEGARLEYGYRGTPELIDLGFDAADAFHRYEIDWTAELMQWWVDGVLMCERRHWNPTPIPQLPMQFHINLWLTRSAALAGRLSHRRLPAHAHLGRVEVSSADRTGG